MNKGNSILVILGILAIQAVPKLKIIVPISDNLSLLGKSHSLISEKYPDLDI